MFLVLGYDAPAPENVVGSGTYYNHNCGGSSDWFITTTYPLTPEIYHIVQPYNLEERFYVFENYCADKTSHLYMFMVAVTGGQFIPIGSEVSSGQIGLYLTNDKLMGYNHEEECLDAVLSGDIDQDEFGGNVYYAELSLD